MKTENSRQDNSSKEEGIITSCVPLSSKQLENVAKILQAIHKRTFLLVNKIDKSLLGGFTIKVADWFYDASLSTQLVRLKQNLISK